MTQTNQLEEYTKYIVNVRTNRFKLTYISAIATRVLFLLKCSRVLSPGRTSYRCLWKRSIVGTEPMTYRSLGGYHIHCETATTLLPNRMAIKSELKLHRTLTYQITQLKRLILYGVLVRLCL